MRLNIYKKAWESHLIECYKMSDNPGDTSETVNGPSDLKEQIRLELLQYRNGELSTARTNENILALITTKTLFPRSPA